MSAERHEIDDGGTVAPSSIFNRGLTIRDYFAAMALQGMAGSIVLMLDGPTRDRAIERIAKTSLEVADAMIAARKP